MCTMCILHAYIIIQNIGIALILKLNYLCKYNNIHLAIMILLSYTKIINGVLGLIFLVYFAPAYGSHKVISHLLIEPLKYLNSQELQ